MGNKLFIIKGTWGLLNNFTGTIAVFDTRVLAEEFEHNFKSIIRDLRAFEHNEENEYFDFLLNFVNEFVNIEVKEVDYSDVHLEGHKLNPTLKEQCPVLHSCWESLNKSLNKS